jgi:hypothetical protein
MMQVELIEGMIANKLELSGMKNEGCEGQCRALLYHLYTAVEMYRLMIPQEKQTAAEWFHFFAKDFRVNQFLKELKSKNKQEKKSPTPLKKRNNKKQKTQKISLSAAGAKSDLQKRKEEFWAELEKFIGKYDRQMVLRFFYYWAEEMKGLNMMRWEIQNSWNTSYRLAAWSKRSFEFDAKTSALKLERTKGKKSAKAAVNTSEQKAAAAEREAADAQREEATAKAKAESVTLEDYLKKNPNSILRTLKKND